MYEGYPGQVNYEEVQRFSLVYYLEINKVC